MTPATAAGTLRAALDEHLGALRAKDAARFAATLGDDVVVVDGKGTIARGTDTVLRSHAEWFGAREPWTFDYEVVMARETAGLALVEVIYRHTPDAAPARFLLSLVFECTADGGWKFVYDQNTPLE